MRTSFCATFSDGMIRTMTRSANSGNATTASAASSAAPITSPPMVAVWVTGTPPTSTPAGNPAANREKTRSATTVSPSNTRSTATDDSDAVNRTGASRVTVRQRMTSPIRNGRMLLVMNPMATACQSCWTGRAEPSSRRRRGRQRTSRSTNLDVATSTAATCGTIAASDTWVRTSCQFTSARAHQSAATEMATPASPIQSRRAELAMSACQGERDQVEELTDQRLGATGPSADPVLVRELGADLGGTLQGAATGIAEGVDIDHIGIAGRRRCLGDGFRLGASFSGNR